LSGPGGAGCGSPLAIILEPSRELAEQTHAQITAFKKYLPHPGLKEVLLIGGAPLPAQIKELQAGMLSSWCRVQFSFFKTSCVLFVWGFFSFSGADIVVGTPGRVEELIDSGKLNLSRVCNNRPIV
jgi:ATP-dependent RNA helicase DDX1